MKSYIRGRHDDTACIGDGAGVRHTDPLSGTSTKYVTGALFFQKAELVF